MRDRNMNKETKDGETIFRALALLGIISLFGILILSMISAASVPVPPNVLQSVSNDSAGSVPAMKFNISGGVIATFNLTARVQDPRWKGFVGNVTGTFALQDSTGSTLFDWALTSVSGAIFATRNSGAITWTNVNCSNLTGLNAENVALNLNDPNDNLNQTFSYSLPTNSPTFSVGSKIIPAQECPVLNTYNSTGAQSNYFYEMALYATGSQIPIYATIMEQGVVGFNGDRYDFQEIVPQNGTVGSAPTAYYLYVQLGS